MIYVDGLEREGSLYLALCDAERMPPKAFFPCIVTFIYLPEKDITSGRRAYPVQQKVPQAIVPMKP